MEKQIALDSCRRLADWYVRRQFDQETGNGDAGNIPMYDWEGIDFVSRGQEWCVAFAMMGMLSAGKTLGDEKYMVAARAMLRYLKALQIFDPFHKEHYGAIRELSPQTAWCYVRDAVSGAWGYLEYYKATGEEEYLERAVLWAKWFMKHGMDETGWPYWGCFFDPMQEQLKAPQMRNDMQGSFQGGGLNFFYQLYKATGDKQWVGPFFEHIADYFCSNIQQKDGFFRTISRETGKVPEEDPQNGLHRGNDDLGTLGLLCAYQVYPKQTYLDTIRKFYDAVFGVQMSDGHFEESCAAIPVILNSLYEAKNFMSYLPPDGAVDRAEAALLARQFPESAGPRFAGGLDETGGKFLCIRSMSYSLIYLLKKYGGDNRFLTVNAKGL